MDQVDPIAPDLRGAPTSSPGGVRAVVASVLAQTAVTLPTFLVGTLAVQIRPSLHFSPEELGLVVGCSYAASAILSIPSGNLADRFGGSRMLRYSSLLTAVALLLVALLVHSWPELALALALSGAASALAQTSSNLLLSRRISAAHQGFAFGIKQAAVPLAFLLGGAAVPALALTVGWRWAFVGAALLALIAAAVVPRAKSTLAARRRAASSRLGLEPAGPLVALALGFGFGLMACSSLGTFLVSAAVQSGISTAGAGLVAVLASASGIAVRVLVGLQADRRGGRHLPVVVGMLLLGAGGLGLLVLASLLRVPWLFVVGATIAFGIGWGWNGLFNFAVVRTHPRSPARATGITQTGGRLGSMVGPLVFGVLVGHFDYPTAWGVTVAEALLGAGFMLVGRRLLQARIRADQLQPAGAPADSFRRAD